MPVPKGFQYLERQKVSDEQLLEDIPKLGVRGVARKYGMDVAGINRRRRKLENRMGVVVTPLSKGGTWQSLDNHPAVIKLGIQDGHILVGSDAHYWPGIVSTAHKAFVEFCREFSPKAVVLNGDELDFPQISRFAPIAWEERPKLAEEIENAKAMFSEIEKASPKARHLNPLGNHSARFETRLATVAPEYAKVNGVHLKDHFPAWEPCWAVFVNDDLVMKHRIKGGMYAPRNSTLSAGRSTICGHLHSQKIMAVTDYNGTRWGVDVGTMADIYGPQFYHYSECNPMDWRSGFCLLTIKGGRLLMPELVWVSGLNEVQFRGEIINI